MKHMFAVYQTDKLATQFPHNLGETEDWKRCSFGSLMEAVSYAQKWCGKNYPVVPNDAKAGEKYMLPFEDLNGDTEFMIIRRYSPCVHTTHCCDVHRSCKYGEEDSCPCCSDIPITAIYGCNCFN